MFFQVDECTKAVVESVEKLRAISPLWEFISGEAESATKPVWT